MTNYCTRYVVHQAANVRGPGNNEDEPSRMSVLNFNTNTYLPERTALSCTFDVSDRRIDDDSDLAVDGG